VPLALAIATDSHRGAPRPQPANVGGHTQKGTTHKGKGRALKYDVVAGIPVVVVGVATIVVNYNCDGDSSIQFSLGPFPREKYKLKSPTHTHMSSGDD